MTWLQENWIPALVVLIAVIALVWWLAARRKPQDIAPPAAEHAQPAKPLEPLKPEIIAVEPAFRKTPAPAPASPPTPAAAPAEAAATPAPEPTPAAPATAPAAGQGDNLQLLKGVGPKLVALLGSLGVTRFEQIAAWTDADIAAIDPKLGNFAGRITRDNWVDQAGYLARGDKAGFEAKYGALGGEL
ncbi:hypothetical protein [Sphingopyxis flava]|uniref:Predicted 5' DNA nuclease, flap endonuclease-1-like, helix-3-turn-helix (H3TH) domain n=1 Tax=Sphingopyxis flava TaxID=1507287 RepID=A0A1T5AZI6_9SPHN|nr:hypothetical protein [Sphingopyxis flava]SKB40385.1 Predicted 5' DNA nuclease, flap endonuclease-1-like, helix-3-turn-helix (H3TH) domain [Sphingopyxis flava]